MLFDNTINKNTKQKKRKSYYKSHAITNMLTDMLNVKIKHKQLQISCMQAVGIFFLMQLTQINNQHINSNHRAWMYWLQYSETRGPSGPEIAHLD